MRTVHRIISCDSKNTQSYIQDKSIALVVTSPPYPMIEMWDECFSSQSKAVEEALIQHKFEEAFENMHKVLDAVWEDVDRVMIDGGVVCINIGDATKNCDGVFKLFSNHSRIINKFISMGYDVLPDIHWSKQTNAPNKFMGSGMYPTCAYVTYEHEYILIFRKGKNRVFDDEFKTIRHESAYFWEERNIWFSDLWTLKGTTQKLKIKSERERSASYPFELAYRLINMYSIHGDTIYDPFVGTGTTTKAAMASFRNSFGTEIDKRLASGILKEIRANENSINEYIKERINNHILYIDGLPKEKKSKLYDNINHKFKVKTKQESEIKFYELTQNDLSENYVSYCSYNKIETL